MDIKYSQEQVQKILNILDDLEIKGVANMNKIMAIIGILNEPFMQKPKEDKTE